MLKYRIRLDSSLRNYLGDGPAEHNQVIALFARNGTGAATYQSSDELTLRTLSEEQKRLSQDDSQGESASQFT